MNMKTIALLAILALGQQVPTASDYRRTVTEKAEELLNLIAAWPVDPPPPPAPDITLVRAGDDLQAALAKGGIIELEAGATFGVRAVVGKSGTVLRGRGARLTAGLYIPPGVNDVTVADLFVTSGGREVITCGDNGPTQTAVAQQPTGIVFHNVTVPTHRGARAFAINCAAQLLDSHAFDVWSSAGDDSQGIAILNSCGPVSVIGGEYVAASENIMVGGDTLKITDCPEGTAADLVFDGLTLSKPDAWRTDGVRRANKNLFELKAGKRVALKNSTLSGSWKDGQDGWAILITPRNGAYIRGVEIDGVTVSRVGAGVQFLGTNNVTATPQATSGVVIRNSSFAISKAENGGRGILALYVGGMLDSTWENVTAKFDGLAIVQADSQVPQGPFVMRGSRMNTGAYAVQAPGVNYGGPAPAGYEGRALTTVFEGNTFTGAPSAFKKFYPANTFQ
jgi:hypothetical protein